VYLGTVSWSRTDANFGGYAFLERRQGKWHVAGNLNVWEF
jgi:hypothetical protein